MKPSNGVWQKSAPALVQRFGELIPDDPRVQRRQMFGYPAAFVNGYLFAGLHQSNLVLRLSPDELAALPAAFGATVFEPMPGRPMRSFVALNGDCLPAAADLLPWMARALARTAELPPKEGHTKRAAPASRTRGLHRSTRSVGSVR